MYVLNNSLFKCPNTFLISYINNIQISNIQFFFNSYVYKRSADKLSALHIVIYLIIDIIAFLYRPNTCFTSLYFNNFNI